MQYVALAHIIVAEEPERVVSRLQSGCVRTGLLVDFKKLMPQDPLRCDRVVRCPAHDGTFQPPRTCEVIGKIVLPGRRLLRCRNCDQNDYRQDTSAPLQSLMPLQRIGRSIQGRPAPLPLGWYASLMRPVFRGDDQTNCPVQFAPN